MLTVRSRAEKDLIALQELIPNATIIKGGGTDYGWRMIVSRREWSIALLAMTQELDYSNFKEAVRAVDPPRAMIYGRLWTTLLDLDPDSPWHHWGGYRGRQFDSEPEDEFEFKDEFEDR